MTATSSAYGLQYSGRGDVPFLSMFRVPNNWSVDSSGKFTKDIETPEFAAALGYVRDLFAAGVAISGGRGNLWGVLAGAAFRVHNAKRCPPLEHVRPRGSGLDRFFPKNGFIIHG